MSTLICLIESDVIIDPAVEASAKESCTYTVSTCSCLTRDQVVDCVST